MSLLCPSTLSVQHVGHSRPCGEPAEDGQGTTLMVAAHSFESLGWEGGTGVRQELSLDPFPADGAVHFRDPAWLSPHDTRASFYSSFL